MNLEQYTYLKTVAHTNVILPLPATRALDKRMDDNHHYKLPENIKHKVAVNVGPYYQAVGDRESVNLSIRKLDTPRIKDWKKLPEWSAAKELVFGILDTAFRHSRTLSLEEVLTEMEMGTSAGVPWSLWNLKKKGDVFKNSDAFNYMIHYDPSEEKYPPVWRIVPKTEWYHVDNLKQGKVRTFIIPPVHLLFWSKVVHGHQNELLKDLWWSAYGFNPYAGGVDRLAKQLLMFSIFVFYDVKGWDRKYQLMKVVHDYRNAHIHNYQDMAAWVSRYTCGSYILLPDGRIVYTDVSNRSGSGTTTGDNIIGHMLALATALLRLYEGDWDKVIKTMAKIFGDDSVLGLIWQDHWTETYIRDVFESVFRAFAFEFDPFVITRDLSDVEFLGFKFQKYESWWIPRYDLQRLSASIVYTITTQDDEASVSRVWSLVIMAAGSGEEIYKGYQDYLEWYLSLFSDHHSPTIQAYYNHGAPDFSEVMDFYLGRESSTRRQEGINALHLCPKLLLLSRRKPRINETKVKVKKEKAVERLMEKFLLSGRFRLREIRRMESLNRPVLSRLAKAAISYQVI